MAKPSDIFWFMDTEYETIRAWVEKNEHHRTELMKRYPGIEIPDVFFNFETFYTDTDK